MEELVDEVEGQVEEALTIVSSILILAALSTVPMVRQTGVISAAVESIMLISAVSGAVGFLVIAKIATDKLSSTRGRTRRGI